MIKKLNLIIFRMIFGFALKIYPNYVIGESERKAAFEMWVKYMKRRGV